MAQFYFARACAFVFLAGSLAGCANCANCVIPVTTEKNGYAFLGQPLTPGGNAIEVKLSPVRIKLPNDDKTRCQLKVKISDSGLSFSFELRASDEVPSQEGSYELVAFIDKASNPILPDQVPNLVRATVSHLNGARDCLYLNPTKDDHDVAVQAVAAIITANLPRRADAELPLTYGLNKDAGYVDITPGMRLKITTTQLLAYMTPPGQQGYYPGSTEYILPRGRPFEDGALTAREIDPAAELADLGFTKVTTDNIKSDNAITVASIADLRVSKPSTNLKKPIRYWRLYQPSSQYASDANANSYEEDERLSGAAIIVGADDPAKFPKQTPIPAECAADTLACFQFHPRGVIVPEIQIFVQGASRWVSLGTRFSDIAAEVIPNSHPATVLGVSDTLDIALYRAWAEEAWDRITLRRQKWAGAMKMVRAPDSDAAVAAEIPLIAGDSLTW